MIENGSSPNSDLVDFGMPPLSLAFDDPGCGHPVSNMEIAEVLTDHGADVNFGGRNKYPPLMAAMRSCNLDGLQFLVSKGADVNARDAEGHSVIMYFSGGIDVAPCLKFLVQHGADIQVEANDGRTAKSWARSVNNKSALEYLNSLEP
ncbi:ankyrin repeat domain-containing protein [Aestuariivirga sp.]|uniref:ankyrin repeat domain-containing protein n=1 Tax=Aestuariivirga sp. TaxID=2650926 RepID=UPI003BAA34B4